MLLPGYVKGSKVSPKMEIKEVYNPDDCTAHHQDGWDLLAIVPGEKRLMTGLPYIVYVMAKRAE